MHDSYSRTCSRSSSAFRSLTSAVCTFVTLVVLLSLCGFFTRPVFAQAVGDLLVTPTRLVFSGKQRSAELVLLNIGKATATYRISFIHMRMTEVGGLEEIENPLPDERFADNLILFTPRVVVLEPRISQTVRLQLRKPANLAPGEYRSHLLFRAVPVDNTTPADGGTPADDAGIRITITPIYGVSIPLIVREGQTSAKVDILDAQFRPAVISTDAGVASVPAAVTFRFLRTGNQSTYGDILVTFTPRGGTAKPELVGSMNGVSVYTPNGTRTLTIPVQPPKGNEVKEGRLTITYKMKADEGGAVWAESTIDLP